MIRCRVRSCPAGAGATTTRQSAPGRWPGAAGAHARPGRAGGCLVFADGYTEGGGEVDFLFILDGPPALAQGRIDAVAG